MSEKLLTIAEAATSLRVHAVTLRALAAAGKVPAFKLGRTWRFVEIDLLAWGPRTLSARGRRRRQGEYMSLYKRPNSRYCWAKIRLPDGGCVCRSSGTTKRQEAQEWLDHTRAGLWRIHRLGERPTYIWQDAVVRWSEEKADKATARGPSQIPVA